MNSLQPSHQHHCCQYHDHSAVSHCDVVPRPPVRGAEAPRSRKPRRIIAGAALVTVVVGIAGGSAYQIERNRIDHTCVLTVNCNIPTEQNSTQQ
jgi:hypothetical protein